MRWLRRDEGFTSLKANGFPASALWAQKKAKKPQKKRFKEVIWFSRDGFPPAGRGSGGGLAPGGCWRPLISAASPISADRAVYYIATNTIYMYILEK